MYALTEVSLLCEKVIATGAKKWMVISVDDGDGKTTLCSQITECLHKNLSKKVHFVDSNHRNPYVANDFGHPIKHAKVSKLMLNDVSKENCLLNANLGEDEILIVDTSPVMIYNRNNIHPLSLKNQVDGAILVVNTNNSKKRDVETVIKMLKQKNISLLAMVLNEFQNEKMEKPSSITHIAHFVKKIKNKGKSSSEILVFLKEKWAQLKTFKGKE